MPSPPSFSLLLRLPLAAGMVAVAMPSLAAEKPLPPSRLRLEIQHVWKGEALQPGHGSWTTRAGETVTLTRLDGLLSDIALRREDGSWMEGGAWYFYVSAGEGRTRALADGIPPGRYTAVRFRAGLDAAANDSDPATWPTGHALHPDVNHLHWGWQGGYIFHAIEGHWTNAPDGDTGFSWHLARAENAAMVELPVEITGGINATLSIAMDASALFDGPQPLSLARDGTSTHSREGDPLAARLRTNVAAAFSVTSLRTDLYQDLNAPDPATTAPPAPPAPLPPGTHPWPLTISERLPRVSLPPDNPLTREGVALGRQLFHDVRLSGDGTQSCASCHEAARGFTDPRAFSVGIAGRSTRRHAMTLANLAWSPAFFWDGRAPSLRAQVLQPVSHPDEMNADLPGVVTRLSGDAATRSAFASASGSEGVNAERIALALEQYLLSLISQDSKFDRAARKLDTLTDSEARGLRLFVTENDPARGLRGADCFHCHGGNLFTDHQFHNNGLPLPAGDAGREEITGDAADRGKFKTPTLRNIGASAPYMHDGRFATLEDVIEHYDHGVVRSPTLDPNLAKHPDSGLGLSADEKKDLAAFLRSLTDESFLRDAPAGE